MRVEKYGRNVVNNTGKEWGLNNVDVTWLITLGRSGSSKVWTNMANNIRKEWALKNRPWV